MSAHRRRGLGRGCAEALAEAGGALVLNARGAEALEATAQDIRDRHGVDVTTVAADITDADGRARVLEAAGDLDILVTNAGGPPPGLWSDWDRDDFIKALDANMLTPIALMTAMLPGMIGARLGPGGEHHLAIGQGTDPATGPVERGAHGADRLCRGHRAAGGGPWRVHQQSPARLPCHGSGNRARKGCGKGAERIDGRRAKDPHVGHPLGPLRHDRGIRRDLRLSVLAACGVHRGGEYILLDGGQTNATI